MAIVLENRPVNAQCFLLRVGGLAKGAPGQFFMLRPAAGSDPFLPRPISLHDADEETTAFLIAVVGRGTALLRGLRPGDELEATGPLGSGFPMDGASEAVLIGGGLGAAPLFYLAKSFHAQNARVSAYLGFSGAPFLLEAFQSVCEETQVNVGGYVTDDVTFRPGPTYYACGPTPMLRAAARKAAQSGAKLYVSLESHMACGVGACLGCSVQTVGGGRRVCKDGPVFDAQEVIFNG